MIQLLQVEFDKGMKFGAVCLATFVAELKKSSYFFFVCVTVKYALLCTILLLWNVCVCRMRERVKHT